MQAPAVWEDRGLAEVVALVAATARAEILPRWRALGEGEVRAKSGPQDLVTVADEAAEARIAAGLRARFPGCAVVGEEAAGRDPALLAQVGRAALCFVVDPVDGTWNFAAGLGLFGTIIARVEHGRTTGAVIHDPVAGDSAVASLGRGAWLLGPAGPVRLQVAAGAAAAAMAGTVSWRYMPEGMRGRVCARLPRLGECCDYRCSAHQYRLLAAGRLHFSVYHRTLPWDHAAGVLLHQEAGGHAARPGGGTGGGAGRAYLPAESEGGLICAPDPAAWEAVRAALFG